MPKGAQNFVKSNERTKAKQKARQASFDFPNIDYFGITDGQKARVRFGEQGPDLTWGICHRIKTGNSPYPQDFICLDQEDEGVPCPACQSDNEEIRKRSTKGFVNLIWRGNDDVAELNEKLKAEGGKPYILAPVYKRNKYGRPEKDKATGQKTITGYEDAVFLWKCSKTVFQELLEKDIKYKGIMSRDFEIKRSGSQMEDTKYHIEPADVDAGPQPMTVGDQVLLQSKNDVDALTTALPFAELAVIVTGEPAESSPEQSVQPATDDPFNGQGVVRSSAFGQ